MTALTNSPVESASYPETAEVFSPNTVAVTTFFFGFQAGVLLTSITLRRVGCEDEARTFLIRGFLGTIAFITALLVLPSSIGTLFALAVNLGMTYFLRKTTEEAITYFTLQGRSVWTTHWIYGIGLGIAVLAGVVLLAVAETMLFAALV